MKNSLSLRFLKTAAWLGAATVAIGAFGAHGLKPQLSEYQIGIFEKGVQYQFYHVIALLLTGILTASGKEYKFLSWSGYLFIAGILFFSGSLYLLACRDLLPFSVAWAGPVTPLGGVCFIAAWVLLAMGIGKE